MAGYLQLWTYQASSIKHYAISNIRLTLNQLHNFITERKLSSAFWYEIASPYAAWKPPKPHIVFPHTNFSEWKLLQFGHFMYCLLWLHSYCCHYSSSICTICNFLFWFWRFASGLGSLLLYNSIWPVHNGPTTPVILNSASDWTIF